MAAVTYQFTPTSDAALFDAEMPSTVLRIHSYGLKRQLIPGWILRKADIAKRLNLSISTVKRALRWLREHGYAAYNRVTNWKMFPAPQATSHVGLNTIGGGSFLHPETLQDRVTFEPPIEKEIFKEKERQHEPEPIPENSVVVFSGENLQGTDHEPMPIPDGDPIPAPEPISLPDPEPIPAQELIQEPVVVSSETIVLEYPPQLTPDQLKNAKHTIKKCKDAALQPEVLFALAYYLSRGGVKNPCAYLAGLVRDANNGTFERIQATGASKQTKPLIPYWQGHKEPEKVDSEAHIQSLVKQYPERSAAINKALPVRSFADFKSNLNLGVVVS